MKVASRAKPDEFDATVSELLIHFAPLIGRERRLEPMLVRRPSSTPRKPVNWQFLISVGRSHSAPHM